MIILALDTSGVDCAACLYDSSANTVLANVTETIGKGHAERLMTLVDMALEQAGVVLSDVGRVGVTIGPGSFTGIRVGVAAARGFALSLGVEAIGITTLETVARSYLSKDASKPVAVAFDAKRDEVYLQLFDAAGSSLSEELLLSLEEARSRLDGFDGAIIGTGAPVLAGAAPSLEKDHFPIETVALLTSEKAKGAAKPKPLYLRGPDARPQTGFALERQI